VFENLKRVEVPVNIRVYQKGEPKEMAIYLFKYTVIGFLFLLIEYWIYGLLPRYINNPGHPKGYDLGGNAVMFFITAFMFILPQAIGAVVTIKTMRPANGFCVLGGFLLAGGIFIAAIEWQFGLYLVFTCTTLFAINAIPHLHFTLKWHHLLYFAIIGAIICYITFRITDYFMDIWTYLQIMFLCTAAVDFLGLKIRQWGYAYLFGWSVMAIYVWIYEDLLLGVYIFFASLICTGGALGLFFAWRTIGNKAKLREE
jgi:hypothetical protein